MSIIRTKLKRLRTSSWLSKIIVSISYGFFSAVGINLFLNSANSYSIGIPGIAQLLHAILMIYQIKISIAKLVILLNIPLVITSLILFGWNYTVFSLIAVSANVVFLKIVPVSHILSDSLTNTIMGSTIIGLGIGLCFRTGFSTGGTDVVVSYIQKKFHKNIGFINTIINGAILIIVASVLGLKGAIYSLIGMVITSYFMDKIYIQQRDVTLVVLTKKSSAVSSSLRGYTHGATMFYGKGIYRNEKTDMLISVIQKNEIGLLKKMILSEDENAFISVQNTSLISGNYIKRL
ncbi:Membrane protein [Lactiplantibacillus plantarum]|uniref:YitT family protein n=1 Tax=Lactiplantibacillus plantarum TaxID=1590 RepID=UPI0004DD5BE2|nr:YitT family protein [Lactiplantibacillus plantarum]KEZ12149.1 Membrane protein [Lactiplantibacillus plantarum]KZU77801.1 putative membrane protein [Lactiplantibacillus plantarum]QKX08702.1 hypothetical protein Heal19_500071 [Lactiplantibacillus plantarum]